MKNNAFTLIELLIVIAIAVIITGALVPLFSTTKQDAKMAKFLSLVETLRDASARYYFDTDEYAVEETSIRRLSSNPGIDGWNGPYISSPLTSEDNPFGGTLYLRSGSWAFDLDGDGINDHGSVANWATLLEVHPTSNQDAIAKKIDDAIDKGLGGSGWGDKGKVEYSEEIVYIFLFGK